MRLIYLASPYSHKDLEVMKQRVQDTKEALGYLASNLPEIVPYSPIAHWSHIAVKHDLDHGFDFWKQKDFHMIKMSTALWVLRLDGWGQSYGLAQEMEYAEDILKPIVFVDKVGSEFVLTDRVAS